MSFVDMQGKTVLITGATQGLGKASAIQLGKMGARLVLLCRNPLKAERAVDDIRVQTGNPQVYPISCDLASQSDIRGAVNAFRSRFDQLDVLINNAGVLVPTRRTTDDGLEETLAINHLAPFLLTNLLLPMLHQSPRARIVNLSSDAHRGGIMHWDDLQFRRRYSAFGAYCQSKLANVLFTYELARKLRNSSVTVNCLHPGVIASGFGKTYGGFTSVLVKALSPLMRSPERGAETSVFLASSPEVEYVTGQYFVKCKPRRSSRASYDVPAAKHLWELSESLTDSTSTTRNAQTQAA